ncbi:peptidylprolyl isomerase [Pilimelia columellifera]|uniref:Peptidylprolyl isomerase n=1 Tax=Pilimelia columellifera subsp. columellifera TaxID=706583 RepID=A0ABN3NP71_9ACTN
MNATNQRDAARARLEQQMAERKSAARRKRRVLTGVAAGAAVVVVGGATAWVIHIATRPVPAECDYQALPAEAVTPTVKDVGKPPAEVPKSGMKTMTLSTNFGDVDIVMDRALAPCTVASFTHLASKNFFNDTKCHRMFPGMLQCGDPSAKGPGYRQTDGTGGPNYVFGTENLPLNKRPAYPAGTVAMARTQDPVSNGSQFFIITQDNENLSPDYTVFGTMSAAGQEIIKKATATGHDGAFEPTPGGGHPKKDIILKSVAVR